MVSFPLFLMALARGQSQLCRVGGLQLRKKILQCTGLKIRCQSSGYIQELESEGRDSKGRKGKEDKERREIQRGSSKFGV